MALVFSLYVVGADYPNKDGGNRRTEIMFCDPGEFIELRLEPRNPADPNAVAVFSARGFQIGYLTAEKAPWIGGILRQGRDVRAIFQTPAAWGAMVRVGLDGAVPDLPPPRDEAFQADSEEYGEWEPDCEPEWEPPPD